DLIDPLADLVNRHLKLVLTRGRRARGRGAPDAESARAIRRIPDVVVDTADGPRLTGSPGRCVAGVGDEQVTGRRFLTTPDETDGFGRVLAAEVLVEEAEAEA